MDKSLLSRRDTVAIAAKSLLVGALAIVAAYHVFRVFDLGHRSYGEGPILALTERLEAGPISARWRTDPPYTLSCYGPAYYWASGALARLGGWRHSIIPGRLVSVGAALFVALLLAIAAARRTKNAELGGLAALVFLVSTPVVEWLPFARVDMLALAGATIAYLTIDNRRGAWLAALAVAAGSLAKPTVALATVPIALHLLACRRYRTAIGFASLTAVLGGATWAMVEWSSNGYFLSSVVSGNRNPMSLWRGYRFGYDFLASPLGVGGCITAAHLWIVSREGFRRSLFSLGFVISLTISTVLVCKRGSDVNYFLEPAMFGSLAIAIDGLPRLYRANMRRATAAATLLVILLTVPVMRELKSNPLVHRLVELVGLAERGESHQSAVSDPRAQHAAAVRSCLADQPKQVGILADGQCVDLVLAAGRQPWLNDSYLYMLLTDNETLDATELIGHVRDGRIQWLIFHDSIEAHLRKVERKSNLWPPEVLKCLSECFEGVPAPAGVFIYRNRLPQFYAE